MKAIVALSALCLATAVEAGEIPKFQVDAAWPKPLPNGWIMGQAAGVAVDAQDHVWVVQRPKTLTDDEKAATFNPPRTKCCMPAPPVLEFDAGRQSRPGLGRPGPGLRLAAERARHLHRPQGLRLARRQRREATARSSSSRATASSCCRSASPGPQTNSTDTTRLGRPGQHGGRSGDERGLRRRRLRQPPRHRLRRRHRRLQAPLGRLRQAADRRRSCRPTTRRAAPAQQFANPVHCVRIAQDGLVYVCDRANDRIQVFRKDGTLREGVLRREERRSRNGSVWDLELWPDASETYLINADGRTTRSARSCATPARWSAPSAATAARPANSTGCTTSRSIRRGTCYTTEVDTGKRAQKFVLRGDMVLRKRTPQ